MDVVAGSLIYDSMEDIKAAAAALEGEGFRIGPIKDRFARPMWGGYRDVSTHLIMPSGLVVELQLHIRPILEAKESLGHQIYEVARELRAGIQPGTLDPQDQKLAEGGYLALKGLSNRLYGNAYMQAVYPRLAANSLALSRDISQDLNSILTQLSGSEILTSLSPSIRNSRNLSSRKKGTPVSEDSKYTGRAIDILLLRPV
jgi:hypothetical protein